MLISKVNVYTANAKAYQTKAQTFKGKLPEPKKCFEMSNNEFFYKYGAYKGIITYNQILSLKNLAEKYQKNDYVPNLAIAFVADPVEDFLFATNQDKLIKGKAEWTDISDYESA